MCNRWLTERNFNIHFTAHHDAFRGKEFKKNASKAAIPSVFAAGEIQPCSKTGLSPLKWVIALINSSIVALESVNHPGRFSWKTVKKVRVRFLLTGIPKCSTNNSSHSVLSSSQEKHPPLWGAVPLPDFSQSGAPTGLSGHGRQSDPPQLPEPRL